MAVTHTFTKFGSKEARKYIVELLKEKQPRKGKEINEEFIKKFELTEEDMNKTYPKSGFIVWGNIIAWAYVPLKAQKLVRNRIDPETGKKIPSCFELVDDSSVEEVILSQEEEEVAEEEEEETIAPDVEDTEEQNNGYVYILDTNLQFKGKDIWKIGIAINVENRVNQLDKETGSYQKHTVIKAYKVKRRGKVEKALHDTLDLGRVNPKKEGFYASYVEENIELVEQIIELFRV